MQHYENSTSEIDMLTRRKCFKYDNKTDRGKKSQKDSQKVIKSKIALNNSHSTFRKIFQLLESISITITRSTFLNGITERSKILGNNDIRNYFPEIGKLCSAAILNNTICGQPVLIRHTR